MRTLSLIAAAALILPHPVRAGSDPAAFDGQEAKLALAADDISQMSDQEYAEAARGVWNPGMRRQNPRLRYFASRTGALSSVYGTLAAFSYRRALDAGPGEESKGAVEAALTTRLSDSDAVAVDPGSLREAGWWSSVVQALNEPSTGRSSGYRGTAITSVRGGRKTLSPADRKAAELRKSLDEAAKGLSRRDLEPAERSRLHAERARLYEELAALYRAEAPAAPEPRAEAPAPSAPAPFSPRAVYRRAGPSVVLIMAVDSSGAGELGTGSLIDSEGHVLTNAHVVLRGSTGSPYETLKVYLKPERVTGDPQRDLRDARRARLLAHDRALDLALLALDEAPAGAAPIPLGDSGRVEAGEPVVAIGHPEQGGLWTLTQGVVSTVLADLGGVEGKDVFQTDASINRGNSGGPLLDRTGSLIGVNTSMARKAADGLTITSVNFALKSQVVKDWLARSGAPARYTEAVPSDAGLVTVADDPPAARPEPAAPAPPAEAPPAETTAPSPEPVKPAILTPPRPYRIEDAIAREIAEMEDLEEEMRGEIEKRRALLQPSTP